MAAPSTARLHHLIDNRFAESAMTFVDLFAMVYLLHLQGHHRAGLSLCRQVRHAVEAPGQKTNFNNFIGHLVGNGQRFAAEISTFEVVNELFDSRNSNSKLPSKRAVYDAIRQSH